MCLASPVGAALVIENPEIHLHPSAQAKICEFLYFIATSGRQLFIETHSDHIFNGFRAGIATGSMEDARINIQFVRLGEAHVTEATKVIIGRRGRIENQQKDLFDQFDMDMNRMIGIGIRKESANGNNLK
jgi:predicted ATPase